MPWHAEMKREVTPQLGRQFSVFVIVDHVERGIDEAPIGVLIEHIRIDDALEQPAGAVPARTSLS